MGAFSLFKHPKRGVGIARDKMGYAYLRRASGKPQSRVAHFTENYINIFKTCYDSNALTFTKT